MTVGVSVTTLRQWEKSGEFLADIRMFGGHQVGIKDMAPRGILMDPKPMKDDNL